MYNKLYGKIVTSSIWLAPDAHRIAWITFLALMDQDGMVRMASAANLAHTARIALEDAQAAIQTFENPDEFDTDQENGGRRIERVPGGWIVLNAKRYRDMATAEQIRAHTRERVAQYRLRKACNASVTPSEAGAGAGAKKELNHNVPQERDCDVVFDHWKRIFDHPRAKMDSKRQRVIERALKLYSTTQLTEAISGYRHSPHHMGENDRHTVYDDIEIFLRDAKHIDAGLRFNNAPGKALPPRPYLPDGTPNPEVF
jgi:hypothetical protein